MANDLSNPAPAVPTDLVRQHRRVALICTLFLASMFGLAYAAVPLYDLFCRATGLGGTPQIAATLPSSGKAGVLRDITMRFDANVASGLPWRFEAVTTPTVLRVGEPFLATYRATNLSAGDTVGTASYNVAPPQSGAFFFKVECFCFTEQKLGPYESAELTVSFYVDPELAGDINLASLDTITLSYTFFPARQPVRSSALPAQAAPAP